MKISLDQHKPFSVTQMIEARLDKELSPHMQVIIVTPDLKVNMDSPLTNQPFFSIKKKSIFNENIQEMKIHVHFIFTLFMLYLSMDSNKNGTVLIDNLKDWLKASKLSKRRSYPIWFFNSYYLILIWL